MAIDKRELMVTIRCLTYNHEPFIRQCLEGFVMQQTNFRFEAIVHDDASTDRTAEIIKEYANKYPEIIKPIFETENQYSKHNGSIRRIMDKHTHGKYVAICEGDDYWIDPCKLQNQVDFLEKEHNYSSIASNSIVVDKSNVTIRNFSDNSTRDIVNPDEIISKRQFHTASILYRKCYIDTKEYKKIPYIWDTMMWCYLLTQNKIRYTDNITCAYRHDSQGITLRTPRYKWLCQCEEWNNLLIKQFSPLHLNKKIVYMNTIKQFIHNSFSQKSSITMQQRFKIIIKSIKYIYSYLK